MKKSSGMLGKLGGLLGGVSSIDFAGDIIKEAAPMIEKSLDRRYEKKQYKLLIIDYNNRRYSYERKS